VGGGDPLAVEPDRTEQLHRRQLELVARVEELLTSARDAIRHSKALARPFDAAPRYSEVPTEGHPGLLEVASDQPGRVMEHNNWEVSERGIQARSQTSLGDRRLAARGPAPVSGEHRAADEPCCRSVGQPFPTVELDETGVADGPGQAARLLLKGAQLAEQVADAADTFASILEETALRGDRTRRLRLAATERQIAEIERRNAARLRNFDGGHGPVTLERVPGLPDDRTSRHRPSPVTQSARTPSGSR
jgi:hypothetical protein